MPHDPFDSRDESGQHPAMGDVAPDLSSSGSSSSVPDRKVSVLCPYCGRPTILGARCEQCRGLLDPLSRQATQNAMGPWFIHDPTNPFRPGCSYEVIRDMARRGRIVAETVLRGPTTRQYWMTASRAPSIANLLGACHNCRKAVVQSAVACPACGADFSPEFDRQYLGLGPVHLLPGQATPEEVARQAASGRPAEPHGGNRDRPSSGTARDRPAAKTSDPQTGDPQTGEYRALVERVERLDRELGTARMLAGIAAVAVVVLAAAVLWFSGVFKAEDGDSSGSWLTPDPAVPAPATSVPAGLPPGPESEAIPAGDGDPPSTNNSVVDTPSLDTPSLDNPALDGPAMDGMISPGDLPDPLPDDPGDSPEAGSAGSPTAGVLAREWALLRSLP
ncbi:MAG: hypothetical protein KF787_07115 [Phycisphaeraceae bacterium]|nr:hypothetical protein [Phycisphaerae bacterium]MBX3392403.1 hypothetical protein [Phycisphaeraceae bacterium]